MRSMALSTIEVRTRLTPKRVNALRGRHPGPLEYDVLLTGPCRVQTPGGTPVAVYLPRVLQLAPHYEALHALSLQLTDNRGYASGAPTVVVKRRWRTAPVYSATVGFMEGRNAVEEGGDSSRLRAATVHLNCRLTAHTARHLAEWESIQPLLREVNGYLHAYVPARAAVQAQHVGRIPPEFVIPGTSFTTLTVNNTFATGFHVDAGDLEEGFSCLAVHRRGHYSGGVFVLGEYRVGVDMQDGDLLLMDAHTLHGNTPIERHSPDAERISLVFYARTDLVHCDA